MAKRLLLALECVFFFKKQWQQISMHSNQNSNSCWNHWGAAVSRSTQSCSALRCWRAYQSVRLLTLAARGSSVCSFIRSCDFSGSQPSHSELAATLKEKATVYLLYKVSLWLADSQSLCLLDLADYNVRMHEKSLPWVPSVPLNRVHQVIPRCPTAGKWIVLWKF